MTTQPAPLSHADIVRFLEAKRIAAKCADCGGTKFGIHDETQHNSRHSLMVFKFPDHDLSGAEMHDIVMVSCNNCARIQLYSRTPIVQWVHDNPSS